VRRRLLPGAVASDRARAGERHPRRLRVAHLRLPVTHRRVTRTTNLLERLFVEERRRLKIVPNGFGEEPVMKLMFGALTRAAER
jgi:transposase-like protein